MKYSMAFILFAVGLGVMWIQQGKAEELPFPEDLPRCGYSLKTQIILPNHQLRHIKFDEQWVIADNSNEIAIYLIRTGAKIVSEALGAKEKLIEVQKDSGKYYLYISHVRGYSVAVFDPSNGFSLNRLGSFPLYFDKVASPLVDLSFKGNQAALLMNYHLAVVALSDLNSGNISSTQTLQYLTIPSFGNEPYARRGIKFFNYQDRLQIFETTLNDRRLFLQKEFDFQTNLVGQSLFISNFGHNPDAFHKILASVAIKNRGDDSSHFYFRRKDNDDTVGIRLFGSGLIDFFSNFYTYVTAGTLFSSGVNPTWKGKGAWVNHGVGLHEYDNGLPSCLISNETDVDTIVGYYPASGGLRAQVLYTLPGPGGSSFSRRIHIVEIN